MVSRAAFSDVSTQIDFHSLGFDLGGAISGDCTLMTVFARSDFLEVRRFLAIQLLGVDIVMPQPMLRAPEVP
jgi:hypothetical protein